jgi:diguanylate cyclase (GGDEF)-like protein
MMAHGEALGVLHVMVGQHEAGQLSAKQQLALSVGEHLALALATLKLQETLRHMSFRDALTDLYNRRYMQENLEREMRRAERQGSSIGVILIDIDHFKRFNDVFGHDAGDAVLQELGRFMRKHVRGSDIACRYGGEEFVLILPGISQETAQGRAEQLRAGVKRLQLHHGAQSLDRITLSLGVALYPEHGASADEVLRAADKALYQAKQGGRD